MSEYTNEQYIDYLEEFIADRLDARTIKDTSAADDKQVGGSHYKDMKIQPTGFIMANSIPFCEANAIKYLCRHTKKAGLQDLDKAIHYIELAKDYYYPGESV